MQVGIPSSHMPLSQCALSSMDICMTFILTKRFTESCRRQVYLRDEYECSIEMHLPYSVKTTESHENELTIIPVLVGALSESKRKNKTKRKTGILKTLQ